MIGTHFTKYCADPEQAQRDFAKGIVAGYAQGVHLPIRHVSGRVTEFLVSAAPLRSPSGEIQVLVSGRDITKLNRLEKELRELNLSLERRIEEEVARSREKDQKLIEQSQRAAEELRAVNESLERRVRAEVQASREKDHMLIQQSRLAAMGEMVHNIAHQWRQPLQGLSVILGNIRDSYALRELTQESLDADISRAQDLLKRMSTTVDDFRDFFRPDREPAAFEIADAVRNALSIMDATLKDNHIEVVASLPAGLKAYGYHNQFAQAILNVIANAKEVIQERKVPAGRIEIDLVQSDSRGILSIQDNGGGIPEAALPKIFDPYFTTKAQGSGIGLYMTKVIVERNHGGSIEAANVGPGACFALCLPLAIERPSA
jgi:signal transduction histidine kinase